MAMSAPKNTTNTHYALAGVGVVASVLNAYVAYKGPGEAPTVDPKYYVYFGIFMGIAFGLGFVLVPEFLMRMKARFTTFDDNHLFLARFVGFNMCIIAYYYYAMLDTETAFKACAIWNTVGVLFGPTYGLLYLDAIMTPDGMAGMPADRAAVTSGS
jgi:hypothetical protein